MKILFAGSQQLFNKLNNDSIESEFEFLFASNLQQAMDISLRPDTDMCVYEWEFFRLNLANDIRNNPIIRVSGMPIVLLVDGNTQFNFEETQPYRINLLMYKPFLTKHLLKKIKNILWI